MTKPFRTETLDARGAQQRLRSLSARERREYADAESQLYWSGAHAVWIKLTPAGGGYRLDFYRGCPCSS